jgi:hypothetical protein
MREALWNVLGQQHEEPGVDRILEAAFFRKRPRKAGSSASVVSLADRREAAALRANGTTDFLVCGGGRR